MPRNTIHGSPWRSSFDQHRALALIGLMLYAGLRGVEVLRLKFNGVQLPDATIRILRGKGRFGGKDRTAYIPPELKYLIEDYLKERRQAYIVGSEFFMTRNGERLTEEMLRGIVERVKRASGVHFSPMCCGITS